MPHLAMLNIYDRSQVSNEGLKSLESAATLSELKIGQHIKISRAAAERFAAARPDVLVNWQGIELEPPSPSSAK